MILEEPPHVLLPSLSSDHLGLFSNAHSLCPFFAFVLFSYVSKKRKRKKEALHQIWIFLKKKRKEDSSWFSKE